jgi:hypothetical protein
MAPPRFQDFRDIAHETGKPGLGIRALSPLPHYVSVKTLPTGIVRKLGDWR